jgi:hypothetical protein
VTQWINYLETYGNIELTTSISEPVTSTTTVIESSTQSDSSNGSSDDVKFDQSTVIYLVLIIAFLSVVFSRVNIFSNPEARQDYINQSTNMKTSETFARLEVLIMILAIFIASVSYLAIEN